jgi:putative glycosyltransferase (TIGR04372 family)
MLQTKLISLGGRPLLLARPQSNHYGHQALEIQVAISRARQMGWDLFVVRDADAVGPALYELDTTAVRMLRPTPGNRIRILARTAAPSALEAGRTFLHARVDEVRAELAAAAWRHRRRFDVLSQDLRRYLKDLEKRWQVPRPEVVSEVERAFAADTYVARRRIAEPLEMRFAPDVAERARVEAAAIGLTDDMKLVAVHCREDGYKVGRDTATKGSRRADAMRNARIETHFAAIDYLVGLGYTVVRVGDPSMTPVNRPGVLDLATHPKRTGLAELVCMFRSRFLICGESGPLNVSYLTNTPVAIVNSTCPVGGYPIRRDGFYMLKRVVDRVTRQPLSLRDMLTLDYLNSVRDPTKFIYLDNTPDEILRATKEMLEWCDGAYQEVGPQVAFREYATDVAVSLRDKVRYVAKHGPDRGFLGEGRLFRFVAESQFPAGA